MSVKKINISLTYPHSSDNISLTSLTFRLLLFLPSLPLPYPFSHFLSNICLLTFFLISVFSLLFPSPYRDDSPIEEQNIQSCESRHQSTVTDNFYLSFSFLFLSRSGFFDFVKGGWKIYMVVGALKCILVMAC